MKSKPKKGILKIKKKTDNNKTGITWKDLEDPDHQKPQKSDKKNDSETIIFQNSLKIPNEAEINTDFIQEMKSFFNENKVFLSDQKCPDPISHPMTKKNVKKRSYSDIQSYSQESALKKMNPFPPDQCENEKQLQIPIISFHTVNTITLSDPFYSLKELLKRKIEKSINICSMLKSQKNKYNFLQEKNNIMKMEEEKMKQNIEKRKVKLNFLEGIRRKNRVYEIIFLIDSLKLQEYNKTLILKSQFDKKVFEINNNISDFHRIENKELFEELQKKFYENFNEFLFSLNCSKILTHQLERNGISNLNVNLFDEKIIIMLQILSRKAEIEITISRKNWLKSFDFEYEIIKAVDSLENKELLASEIFEIYKEEIGKIGFLKISKFCNKILYII